MKFCEYCSEIALCCEALGIKYGWSHSNQFFDGRLESACRVEPPTWNDTADPSYVKALRECDRDCGNCYIDTDRVISFQSIVSADITRSWNVFTVFVFVVVVLTPLVRTTLYLLSRYASEGQGGVHPYIDRYLVIMPMFREYLFYDVFSNIILLLVYLFTIQSTVSDDKMTCCSTSQSVFLGFFLWIIFVNETMPFLMLMQRAYTKRTCLESLSVTHENNTYSLHTHTHTHTQVHSRLRLLYQQDSDFSILLHSTVSHSSI